MFSFCGCSSHRRPKRQQILSNKTVPNAAKALSAKSEPIGQITVALPDSNHIGLDDFGIQNSAVPKRKSSITIESVKAKLIRHLSHDKDSSQKPQGSLSSDKEEIARRAELRRFRAKRIQEELKEDYSKYLSPQNSIRSTRYLSALIDIGLPGHGPRDAIEFSIDSGSYLPAPCPSPIPSFSSPRFIASNPSMKRWSSCPATIGDKWIENANNSYGSLNTSDPVRRVPFPGKIYGAKSLPDLQQAGMRRPPSAKINMSNTTRDSNSTLNIWLALQESQSRNSPALSSNDRRVSSASPLLRQNTQTAKGFTGTNYDAVTIPHPVRRLGGSQCRVSATGLQRQYAKPTSKPNSYHRYRNRSREAPSCTKKDQSSSSSRGHIVASETPGGISSSYYPSVMQSIQPSPSRSNSPVNFLSPKDLQSLELSPFDWHDNNSVLGSFGHPSDDVSSYVTAHDGSHGSQSSGQVTKGGHDGPADANRSLNRRFLSSLRVRKGRGSYAAIASTADIYTAPRKNKNISTERSALPARWRSASGSWDIQASLQKRMSSKLWHQPRVASASTAGGISTAQEPKIKEDATDLSTDYCQASGSRQGNLRATGYNIKGAVSPERGAGQVNKQTQVFSFHTLRFLTRVCTRARIVSSPTRHKQVLSRDSLAYNALQKVSQRNVSTPPLSWARYQSRKQTCSSNRFPVDEMGPITAPGPNDGDSGHPRSNNSAGLSVPSSRKTNDLFKIIADLFQSRDPSPDESGHASAQTTSTKLPPLELLKIDEIQTSPILGEIQMYRRPR
ncbi:hypothetical protein NLG97_g6165 [Lecanicillium saksenae]|uniref:Uncharacterized protein n=1 Tax=Lecanicillium saksenae TaxID=468837 RepID=A0ACC1QRR4_9HYPO|nr:hypothetical protein NLG97_g6165 [Lecanicillium saksenae]